VSEVTSCLRIHTECGSVLNGVSLEFTGEMSEDGFSVTECLGGSMELSEEELGLRYQVSNAVQPRAPILTKNLSPSVTLA
jgi:3-deoxy-7-phosphoheptulonate synthase